MLLSALLASICLLATTQAIDISDCKAPSGTDTSASPSTDTSLFRILASSPQLSTKYQYFFSVGPGENGEVALTPQLPSSSTFSLDSSNRLTEESPTPGFIGNQDVSTVGSYVYFNSEENVEENGSAVVTCRLEEGCALECDVNGGNVESWFCNGRWYLLRPGSSCGERFEMVVVAV